jgi:hypothetical protein
LESDVINSKLEKVTVEVSKAKLEESQRKIDALNSELKDVYRRYLQHLQEKGRLCDKDCVLCCLLWICHKKMDIYPCGRYLEKIITYEACLQNGNKFREELGCGNFMYLLMRCGIIDHAERIKTYKLPDDINKAWGELMDVDAENLVVIVGRSIPMQLGHCVVCDLKTRDRKNGRLTFHDLQQDMSGTGNITDFRQLLKDDRDIKLYTVNFGYLQEIIGKHSDTFHGTYSKYNITKSTDTDDTPIIVDCDDECAACDTERVGRDDERSSSDTKCVTYGIQRAANGSIHTTCDADRVAHDVQRTVIDSKRLTLEAFMGQNELN